MKTRADVMATARNTTTCCTDQIGNKTLVWHVRFFIVKYSTITFLPSSEKSQKLDKVTSNDLLYVLVHCFGMINS